MGTSQNLYLASVSSTYWILSNNLHLLSKGSPPFLIVMELKPSTTKEGKTETLLFEKTVRHRLNSEAKVAQQVKSQKLNPGIPSAVSYSNQ